MGEALLMGAGYEAFTYSTIKAMTGGGGSWDARVAVGTREYVGLEAGYVGAARSIQGAGLAENTLLVSNGVEGAVRINISIVQGPTLLDPFGFVGLGWQRYDLTQPNSSSSLAGADDVMSVPYGGGVEFTHRMLLLDARFTYRQAYLNDLLRTNGGRLNTWGVGGSLGVEFWPCIPETPNEEHPS